MAQAQQVKSEYDIQAENFLKQTNTQLTWKYVDCTHNFFRDNSKTYEKRLIWEFTLTRGERAYTSQFGQSLHDTQMQLLGHTTTKYTLAEVREMQQAIASIRTAYGETKYTQFRKDGSQVRKTLIPPSAYDLLACLEKYPVEDIDSFASEFGFLDSGTKVSEIVKVHKACTEQYNALLTLFNDYEMGQLREIN